MTQNEQLECRITSENDVNTYDDLTLKTSQNELVPAVNGRHQQLIASATGSSFESRSSCLVLSIVKNAPKANAATGNLITSHCTPVTIHRACSIRRPTDDPQITMYPNSCLPSRHSSHHERVPRHMVYVREEVTTITALSHMQTFSRHDFSPFAFLIEATTVSHLAHDASHNLDS